MTSYWIIEGSKAKAKWDEMFHEAEQKRTVLKEWVDNVGGTGKYLRGYDGCVEGIEFEDPPGKDWKTSKKCDGYYLPKRNTKNGKLLNAEMETLRGEMSRIDVGNVFLGHGMIFSRHKLLSCGWETTKDGVILLATESESEEQWEPITGLRKLKDSEYWTIKESE